MKKSIMSKLDTAVELRSAGHTPEHISKTTGLSIEEIKKMEEAMLAWFESGSKEPFSIYYATITTPEHKEIDTPKVDDLLESLDNLCRGGNMYSYTGHVKF